MDNEEIVAMINRTNNALESYNSRLNVISKKQPNVIEFVQLVEKELHHQAQTLEFHSGKRREVKHKAIWVSEILGTYYRRFKERFFNTDSKTVSTERKKKGQKIKNKAGQCPSQKRALRVR